MPTTARLATVLLLLLPSASFLRADGGVIHASEQRGPFRVTVFISPTLPQAGEIDVSVLVQEISTKRPRVDMSVRVVARSLTQPSATVSAEASNAQATNKLFQDARLMLPIPGAWDIEVTLEHLGAREPIRFLVDLEAPSPGWFSLAGWITWPVVAVVMFTIHRLLVARRTSRDRN